jgi:ArsR family transcriptional regulator, arsenate/arsenite/antimonite-responsive transcriptional repressor
VLLSNEIDHLLDILMIVDIIDFIMIDQNVFRKAIADDTRYELMQHLCCVWLNVSDCVDKLGGRVKQPTVSHHLKELEEAGLVVVQQEGRQRFYMLNQSVVSFCCGQLFTSFKLESGTNMIPLSAIEVKESQ